MADNSGDHHSCVVFMKIEDLVNYFYRSAWALLTILPTGDSSMLGKTKRSLTFIIGTTTYRVTVMQLKENDGA